MNIEGAAVRAALFQEVNNMRNDLMTFVIGAFAGSYFNNAKFRADVNTGIQKVVGKGIDALNSAGKQNGARYERNVHNDEQHTIVD